MVLPSCVHVKRKCRAACREETDEKKKKRGNIGGKKMDLSTCMWTKGRGEGWTGVHFSFHFCKPYWISGNELMAIVTVTKSPGTNKLPPKILLAVLGICWLRWHSSFSFFFFFPTGLMNNWLRVPEQIKSLGVLSDQAWGFGQNPCSDPVNWAANGGTLISPWTKNESHYDTLFKCGHYIDG